MAMIQAMKRSIGLAAAVMIAAVAILLVIAARAEATTNSFNGCVLAMTGITAPGHSESEINEQWCIRFREAFRDQSPKDTDQYLMCMLMVSKLWQTSHQWGEKPLPDAASTRIVKGCAMMIWDISEEAADTIIKKK
jgi:hypothetical protein